MTFGEAAQVLASFDAATVFLAKSSPLLHRIMREEFADQVLTQIWPSHWHWDDPATGTFKHASQRRPER